MLFKFLITISFFISSSVSAEIVSETKKITSKNSNQAVAIPIELKVRFKDKTTQFKVLDQKGKYKLLQSSVKNQKSIDLNSKDIKYILKKSNEIQKKSFNGKCELGDISLLKNDKPFTKTCITSNDSNSIKLKKFANLLVLAGTLSK